MVRDEVYPAGDGAWKPWDGLVTIGRVPRSPRRRLPSRHDRADQPRRARGV